jgi:hypothetical protein
LFPLVATAAGWKSASSLTLIARDDVMPFRNEAFEPEVISVMNAAYEKVCSSIQAGPHAEIAKEIAARRIIALVRQGWTDADRLCSEVLKASGLERRVEGGGPPIAPTTY